jgi:hypothetical protein
MQVPGGRQAEGADTRLLERRTSWLDDQLQVVDAKLGKLSHRIYLDPRHQLDLAPSATTAA